jgi:Protein of unknown function (DUF2971)
LIAAAGFACLFPAPARDLSSHDAATPAPGLHLLFRAVPSSGKTEPPGLHCMILYKYVSLEAGRKILESHAIAFSQPKDFNDPFDMPSHPDVPDSDPIFGPFRKLIKDCAWAEKTGILSLTRSPVNPLMWAHYADKHRGLVLGIDVRAARLTDEKSNLVPAQFGSVIYVSRRDATPLISTPDEPLTVGANHHFPVGHYETFQRVFLHKSLYWAYEEEVRVLKCLDGIEGRNAQTPSGSFQVLTSGGRKYFLYSLPAGSIRELYIGIRAPTEMDSFFLSARQHNPNLTVYECTLDDGALTVGFEKLSSEPW